MSKYDNLILGFGQGAGTGDGKLFVLKPTDGNGDFDVVRATTEFIDIDGVITEIPPNYPTMPTKNGGCPILLVNSDTIDGAEAPIDNTIGVFQTKITALADDLAVREISLTNNSSSNRISFRYNITSNSIGILTVVGGSPDIQRTFTVSDITEENNVKVSWEDGVLRFKLNDVQVLKANYTPPTGLAQCDLHNGDASPSNLFEGYVRELNVYNETSTFASTATTFNAMANTAKYNIK